MSSTSTSSSQDEQTAVAVTMNSAAASPADLFVELSERPLPSPAETWILHGRVPAEGRPVVVMSQTALLQVNAHSNSNTDVELGGALLGHAYRHQGGVVVEVKAALPAVSPDHGPVHFTFGADSWSNLHRDRTAHYPELDIIGWFHTHPDLGVFYSGDDVVVHSAAFTQPWHVGLVVDPIREEAAYFGWQDGKLAPMDGFYELPDRQPEPITPWRIVPTTVWDRSYEAQPRNAETGASSVYLPGRGGWLGFSGREVGVLMAALVGLAGLLLAALLVVPLWQRATLLENAVVALADRPGSLSATCPDANLRIINPIDGATVSGTVRLLGTAVEQETSRYQIDMRPRGGESWSMVHRFSGDESLDLLARWKTDSLPNGPYELRLAAIDRNNIRLGSSAPCIVGVNVVNP